MQLKGTQVKGQRRLQLIRRLSNTSSKRRRNGRNNYARIQRLSLRNSLRTANTVSTYNLMRVIQGNLRYNRRSRRIMTNRNPNHSINRETRSRVITRRIRLSTSNNGSLGSEKGLTIMRMRPSSKYSRTQGNMQRRMTRARYNSILSSVKVSRRYRDGYHSSRSQRLGRNMRRCPTRTDPRITKDGGMLRILGSSRLVSRFPTTMYTATHNSLTRRTKVGDPGSKGGGCRDRRSTGQYRRNPTNAVLALRDVEDL